MTIAEPQDLPTRPSDLDVLCAGAMHPIVDELIAAFERTSGMQVTVRFASSGGVKARVLAGEAVDVAITTQSAIDELRQFGKVLPETMAPLARSAIGVAVRAGAPRPDIGSVESFARSLRNAKSIAMADPTTGSPSANHFVRVLERLAMTAELQPKIRYVGGRAGEVVVVGEAVARGEADIGIQQIAEILTVPGIDLVGELPADLQQFTVFCGAVAAIAKDAAKARRLIGFLASPIAAPAIRAKGMEPVPA
jgi:molybdate transport system substrate-binding protein